MKSNKYESDFTPAAIININKLLKLLKTRLNSSGKSQSTDDSGNLIYTDCDIFPIDNLVDFLSLSLSQFNSTPLFTTFTFEDDDFVNIFSEILVTGASLNALATQSLIERGREYKITNKGIECAAPNLSELLNTQYTTLLSNYSYRLQEIKKHTISF